jgi:DNA-binding GntR family transcriptional regulator
LARKKLRDGAASKRNIFEALKMSIMQGAYKPRERLIERNLADQFGVSRTPIREALHRLESLSLVRIHPNQGAQVADFSLDDLDALYLVRIYLEQLAGKLACSRISPGEIKKLGGIHREFCRAFAADDFQRMIEKDQEFHFTLIQCCRNTFLVRVIQDLRWRSYPFSHFYFGRNKTNVRTSIAQHGKMLEALRKKNVSHVTRLVKAQLSSPKQRYLRYLAQGRG